MGWSRGRARLGCAFGGRRDASRSAGVSTALTSRLLLVRNGRPSRCTSLPAPPPCRRQASHSAARAPRRLLRARAPALAICPRGTATQDLIDYEEDEEAVQPEAAAADSAAGAGDQKEKTKGSYVGIHATGFRDFLLKPELLRAIVDCGFEHPSEGETPAVRGLCRPWSDCATLVQQECIPQAVLGTDVLCQAKSGMGKTAVFVLATLQQLDATSGESTVLVLCHTRELAFQIKNEYARFSKYMPDVKTAVFYGGMPVKSNVDELQEKKPQIIVGTPGRILALVKSKDLPAKNIKHFVLDECDKMLEQLGEFYIPLCQSALATLPAKRGLNEEYF